MGAIRIVNIGRYIPKPKEILIKVDRSSVLGSPYYLKNRNSFSEREYVCDLYEDYLKRVIDTTISDDELQHFYARPIPRQEILDELNRIQELAKDNAIALGCWCVPKRCHAITILKYLIGTDF